LKNLRGMKSVVVVVVAVSGLLRESGCDLNSIGVNYGPKSNYSQTGHSG